MDEKILWKASPQTHFPPSLLGPMAFEIFRLEPLLLTVDFKPIRWKLELNGNWSKSSILINILNLRSIYWRKLECAQKGFRMMCCFVIKKQRGIADYIQTDQMID